MFTLQFNKLRSILKYNIKVTLEFLSNGESNDETNFQHKLIITDGQVLKLLQVLKLSII